MLRDKESCYLSTCSVALHIVCVWVCEGNKCVYNFREENSRQLAMTNMEHVDLTGLGYETDSWAEVLQARAEWLAFLLLPVH